MHDSFNPLSCDTLPEPKFPKNTLGTAGAGVLGECTGEEKIACQ